MKGYLIVIEGLDGTGKSSIIKLLLEKFNFETTLGSIHFRGFLGKGPLAKLIRLLPFNFLVLFELLYNVYLCIYPNIFKGKIVFVDRYIYSISTHIEFPRKNQALTKHWLYRVYFFSMIKFFSLLIPKPDALIYLTVDNEIRVKRLTNSMSNPWHQRLLNTPGLVDRIESSFSKSFAMFSSHKLCIDTTNMSLEEISIKIANFLDKNFILCKEF